MVMKSYSTNIGIKWNYSHYVKSHGDTPMAMDSLNRENHLVGNCPARYKSSSEKWAMASVAM